MPFVKGDPRINRKGRRPRKKPPVQVTELKVHDFAWWSEKNEFTRARFDIAIRWQYSWAVIEKLIEHKVIIRHKNESLEWTLNKESLAKLFHEWPWETGFFRGIKWGPVETAFNIKRYSLRHLTSTGGSRYYYDDMVNPDYEKVMRILMEMSIIN